MSVDGLRWQPPQAMAGAQGMRPVLFLVGQVLLAASGFMLLPLAVDIHAGHRDWTSFAMATCVAAVVGAGLAWPNRGLLRQGLSRKQAFILTPLSWTMVAAIGALPFYFSEQPQLGGNLANSVFESVSGITTTGATVMTRLEEAPPGILLWRALLQWMGGIGIIATAIAILPTLGIGGMQLFRTESSDRSPKAMPRVRQIAMTIGGVYIGLTLLAVLVYWWAGMAIFDAVAHALSSIATGGYSTSDASFGAWESNGIQWIAAAFMLSGAVPFVLYVRMLAGDARAMFDRQVKAMLALVALVAMGMGLWLAATGQYGLEAAFRHATFNVVSVISTTGYSSTDYGLWGGGVVAVFFGLLFVGGCTGSTSGGIKIFRFEVTFVMLRAHFLRLVHPRGVFPRTYGPHVIPEEVIGSVVAFLAVYFICYATGTIVLMGLGLDFLTSASGAASALSNVGPGLGDVIGPAGTFGPLPATAKWVLSSLMLLGRLEVFTVLVLFLPRFWRG